MAYYGGDTTKRNRGVVFQGAKKLQVQNIPYPTFDMPIGGKKRNLSHAVILKVILSNICGSDGHMYRGRTSAQPGLVFGHEITGEIVEMGSSVEGLSLGDWVIVPFNIACGRCSNCREQFTNLCQNVSEMKLGGAYGYVSMGDWPGGQAEFVLVPYADFNCVKIPDKTKGREKILDLALLSDILPTGYDGAIRAGVSVGKTVYVAGAGPVGLCCAASCFVLGASKVIVGDPQPERLALAKMLGCETVLIKDNIDLSTEIRNLLGKEWVDVAVDCVGFECNGQHGMNRKNPKEEGEVLNHCFSVVKPAGTVGVPGVYLPEDPGASTEDTKHGSYMLDYSKAWSKGVTITQGQCPVLRYAESLMKLILSDRLSVAKALNIKIISLDQAPAAYERFSQGEAVKYIIDPHNTLGYISGVQTP